jgi:N-acetylglutamate synthase
VAAESDPTGTPVLPLGEHDDQMAIRPFRLEDYETVVGIWNAARLSYHPSGRDCRERIARELETGQALFYVAEREGEIVGVVFGTHDGRRGWINRLAVLPAWQHRGIARRLVREVETALSGVGIDVICALIEDHNQGSMRFFANRCYIDDRDIHYFSKRSSADS